MSDDPWELVLPRSRRARLPRVGDGVTEHVNLIEAYATLCAVSVARAEFLGALLADQFEAAQAGEDPVEDGVGGIEPHTGLGGPQTGAGLIGFTYSAAVVGDRSGTSIDRVATGEEVRALVRLEAEERDRAAKLIKDSVNMGVALQQVEAIRSYARTISAALRSLVTELGLSFDDEPVLRAAQRAGLAARRAVGQDDGDPDTHIGPQLTPAERVRTLRAALAAAEADAQRHGDTVAIDRGPT